MHDKEMASCGIRIHCPGHRKNPRIVREVIRETVLRELSFDCVSRASHTGSVRTSALDHKAADHAMEDQSVIKIPYLLMR